MLGWEREDEEECRLLRLCRSKSYTTLCLRAVSLISHMQEFIEGVGILEEDE